MVFNSPLLSYSQNRRIPRVEMRDKMTDNRFFIGHLDERWADKHSAFTIEQPSNPAEPVRFVKSEGPMFYTLIEFTLKQFVERLGGDQVIKIAETIRHLHKTYERVGVYMVDGLDGLESLKVDEVSEGDVIVFCYQQDDEVVEVYRGVLGHRSLEPTQSV